MAKFETYTTKFGCPSCRRSGEATVKEEENPVYSGGLHPRIMSISDGFEVRDSAQIVCKKCGVKVKDL